MAVVDDFKARFPEFDQGTVDQYLPPIVNVWSCYYGGDYDQPCDKEVALNIMAHLLVGESSTSSASIKDQASKSVGSVSVSYTAASGETGRDYAFWNTTKYGQRYLILTASHIGGYFV